MYAYFPLNHMGKKTKSANSEESENPKKIFKGVKEETLRGILSIVFFVISALLHRTNTSVDC